MYIHTHTIMSFMSIVSCMFSFLILVFFISVALDRISSTLLNRSSDSLYAYLIPDLKGKL